MKCGWFLITFNLYVIADAPLLNALLQGY